MRNFVDVMDLSDIGWSTIDNVIDWVAIKCKLEMSSIPSVCSSVHQRFISWDASIIHSHEIYVQSSIQSATAQLASNAIEMVSV